MLSGDKELKRLWKVGTLNVRQLLSQKGHWLPCLLPAKFKMVTVVMTLIWLPSWALFPSVTFFEIEFDSRDPFFPLV